MCGASHPLVPCERMRHEIKQPRPIDLGLLSDRGATGLFSKLAPRLRRALMVVKKVRRRPNGARRAGAASLTRLSS